LLLSSYKILIIDGNSTSRQLVERVLRNQRCEVMVASNALEGIDLARTHLPDLVLTEIDLPDMTGRELATNLTSDPRFAEIPIVAIMNPEDPVQRSMALAAGITGFIEKPIDFKGLPMQLEFFLSGGSVEKDSTNMMNQARTRFLQEVVKRLESRIREIREQNLALERLNQMKDTFIQLTAHELRTPLSLLLGYSDLLASHPEQVKLIHYDKTVQSLVSGLQTSVERIQNVVEEVITTSEIMTDAVHVKMRPSPLLPIVQRVLNDYHEALIRRQLAVHYNPKDWDTLPIDEHLIYRVLSNLLGNAIKYTPNEGEIYLMYQKDAKHAFITVRDTGIGIDPEHHEKIFERFYVIGDINHHSTSKTAFMGGGLGLGLAICKGIVEAHGGRIWVESEGYDMHQLPGSEFIVMLPLHPVKK
jgi:signal transduction histidine kinase